MTDGQDSSKVAWVGIGLAVIGLVVLLNFNSATCVQGPTTTIPGVGVLEDIEVTTFYRCTAPGGFDAVVLSGSPPAQQQIWAAYMGYMATASIATVGGLAWFLAQKLVGH